MKLAGSITNTWDGENTSQCFKLMGRHSQKTNCTFKKRNGMYIRYVHKDGKGLLNNQALDYDKLSDDEYFEIEEWMLKMQQPHRDLHGKEIIFVFTEDGEKKFLPFIKLLKKASKSGVSRKVVSPDAYEIAWESGDGQLGLIQKQISKRD